MSIYKELYIRLFRQVSKTIAELQQAQQQCEELYMQTQARPPVVLAKEKDTPMGASQNEDET